MEIIKEQKQKKRGPKPLEENEKILSELFKEGKNHFKPRSDIKEDLQYMLKLMKAFHSYCKRKR